nr:hypothetical protein [Tanacetum cinerariifolium]
MLLSTNDLVAPKERLKIENYNARIEFSKPQREETYQVTLDALKLSPCYPAFLITAEICPRLPKQDFVKPPFEEEMVSFIHELGYSGKCIFGKSSGLDRLRLSRAQILWDKTISIRNRVNIHTVRNDTLLGTLKFVSKTQDYQMYGALIPNEMINQDIKDSKACKTYLDFATRKATPKKARKFKKVTLPSKKLYTPGVYASKKKAPTKVDRGKGIDLLFEATLLEVTQLKKTLKKSKLETHKLHASSSGDGVGSQPKVSDEQQDKTTGIDEGTGTKLGVLDVPKDQHKSENESCGNSKKDDKNDDESDAASNEDDVDSDANGDNEASDSEKTDYDKDENPNLYQIEYEEEEYKKDYVRTPNSYGFIDDDEEYEELYKDVNVRLKDAEHEKERKGDAEMTDDGRDDGNQQTTYEQVKDDEHVILITVHDTQKTEVPLQSSFISFDFSNLFLNLDNASPVDNKVVSMMNVKVRHEEPSTQIPPLLTVHVMVILETSTVAAPTIPLTISSITPLPQ